MGAVRVTRDTQWRRGGRQSSAPRDGTAAARCLDAALVLPNLGGRPFPPRGHPCRRRRCGRRGMAPMQGARAAASCQRRYRRRQRRHRHRHHHRSHHPAASRKQTRGGKQGGMQAESRPQSPHRTQIQRLRRRCPHSLRRRRWRRWCCCLRCPASLPPTPTPPYQRWRHAWSANESWWRSAPPVMRDGDTDLATAARGAAAR